VFFFLIPYGTDRHQRTAPYVTYTIIVLNLLVYAWLTWRFFIDLNRDAAFRLAITPGHFRWYTIITHLFTHDAPLPMHVGFNMLFLWVFGSHVEEALGRGMFLVVYFAGGLAAATVHTLVSMQSAAVPTGTMYLGASGAIAAVMGLFAVRFYRTSILVWYFVWLLVFIRVGTFAVSSVIGLALWLGRDLFWGVYNLFHASNGGVAYWAHIGGFVFGVLVAYALGMRSEGGKEYSLEDAWAAFRAGRFQSAVRQFEQLGAQQPLDPDAQLALAECYDRIGDHTRAVEVYANTVEMLGRSGRCEEAVEAFRTSMGRHLIDEFPPALLYRVGCCYEETGQYSKALQTFDALARHYPQSKEAEAAVVKCGQICLDRLLQPADALRYLRIIQKQRPDSEWISVVQNAIARAERMLETRSDNGG